MRSEQHYQSERETRVNKVRRERQRDNATAEVQRVAKLCFTIRDPSDVDRLSRAGGPAGAMAKRRTGSGIIAQLTRGKMCYNEGWTRENRANNYNTTSRSGYCPNSMDRGDGQRNGRGDWTMGYRALWIIAALERSCESDVPACQQQLCIIGCLPHVNACLLSPFERRPPPSLPTASLSGSFLL